MQLAVWDTSSQAAVNGKPNNSLSRLLRPRCLCEKPPASRSSRSALKLVGSTRKPSNRWLPRRRIW